MLVEKFDFPVIAEESRIESKYVSYLPESRAFIFQTRQVSSSYDF